MFSLDHWQEILDTLRKHQLRTLLTGFSVAWGIFMLIILLGSGNGLAHGVEYQFRDDAINSLWIRSGQTSLPHEGHRPGRQVQFTNEDYDQIADGVGGVDHATSRYYVRSPTVTYGAESSSYSVRAVHPGVGLLELAAEHMPHSEYFLNPSVDLRVAVYATLLLVLAGTLAGSFPARKAARIRPIEALRDE